MLTVNGHSIKYRGNQIWNDLPTSEKSCKPIHIVFKKKIKEYVLFDLTSKDVCCYNENVNLSVKYLRYGHVIK